MTKEEAIFKLDEAIKDKVIHHSARDDYETLCNTSKGREDFKKILNYSRQLDSKIKERRTSRAARKAASCGKEKAV